MVLRMTTSDIKSNWQAKQVHLREVEERLVLWLNCFSNSWDVLIIKKFMEL